MKSQRSFRRNLWTALLLGVLGFAPLQGALADLAADLPVIPAPVIPTAVFRVTDFGAVGDGKTMNTRALQHAIDACSKAGGGTVDVPAGRFLTGPLTLASSLNLHLEKDSTLLLSSDVADYPVEKDQYRNCIVAENCQDLAITGPGTIDGQGAPWWSRFAKARALPPGTPAPPHRPFMVVLRECTRVVVQDVSLANSPMFHLVTSECRDVLIERVHIRAPEKAPNTDGIDPSGWNFLIKDCTFDVGDDCIALKPGQVEKDGQPSCENFTITHCTFRHGHGMSIGGQTRGGLRHMTVRDSTFDSTQAGIRLKAPRGAGGLVDDVTYENLVMKNVKVAILITSYYPTIPKKPGQDPAQPVDHLTPIWRNIRINNVTAAGGEIAGEIIGLPEMPVSDVVLANVKLSARKGMEIANARGIRFVQSSVTADSGAPLSVENAEVIGLDPGGTNQPVAGPTTANAAGPIADEGTAAGVQHLAVVLASGKDGGRVANDLVVAADGSGQYTMVQQAIDAAHPGRAGHPTTIRIRPGTYKELIHIPQDKRFIRIAGSDAEKTVLTNDLSADLPGPDGKPIGTFYTPSTTISADDFVAENLTFENAAGPKGQAVALRVDGDRVVFRHCRFLGWQDTLLDNVGRHYYDQCAIQGSVDFIFGEATSVFEQCDITEIRESGGVLTAPRTPQSQPYGMVFLHCCLLKATGVRPGSTTLMRPWGEYGMAAFIDCAMDDDISERGWREWDGREKTCRAFEYKSKTPSGQPIDLSRRAPWAHPLTASEAAQYTLANIFNGWDARQDTGHGYGSPSKGRDFRGELLIEQVADVRLDLVEYCRKGDACITPSCRRLPAARRRIWLCRLYNFPLDPFPQSGVATLFPSKPRSSILRQMGNQ